MVFVFADLQLGCILGINSAKSQLLFTLTSAVPRDGNVICALLMRIFEAHKGTERLCL